jgi:hypothetical protein
MAFYRITRHATPARNRGQTSGKAAMTSPSLINAGLSLAKFCWLAWRPGVAAWGGAGREAHVACASR